jgi:hypothetical protein
VTGLECAAAHHQQRLHLLGEEGLACVAHAEVDAADLLGPGADREVVVVGARRELIAAGVRTTAGVGGQRDAQDLGLVDRVVDERPRGAQVVRALGVVARRR